MESVCKVLLQNCDQVALKWFETIITSDTNTAWSIFSTVQS